MSSEKEEFPLSSRAEEEQKLAHVIAVAEQNLEKGTANTKKLGEDLHDLLESYGAKDVEALSIWRNTAVQYEEAQADLERLKKARKTPYFGRIDFIDENLKRLETFYIGKVGITRSVTEIEVVDWRAPVANAYYENGMGKCSYTVQGEGTFSIDLKRKRTYEIAADTLVDYYDSDVVANDELLTKYLAKNKKAVLGEIIATIQKEQNAIIRKSPRQNLIVQGVAGSGKTTVAMHRISYILYNYADDFRPEDFYIVGSNQILLGYITSVLPDLDVHGVRQMTMSELFVRLLYEEWDEKTMHIREGNEDDPRESRKGTLKWFKELEEYCRRLEWDTIPREDVFLQENGSVQLLSQAEIETYLRENPAVSIQNKILMLNKRLLAKTENELTGKEIAYSPDEKKEIKRRLRFYFGGKEWKKSIFELYAEFLMQENAKGTMVEIPENDYGVYDLAALAYLYKRVKETELIREASHIVIDEAQDFGMMAYAVLKYCVRDCTFTIMGDVSQNIHYGCGLNDWEELREHFLTGMNDSFHLLKKSYRNTVEISEFATEILHHGSFPVYPVEPIIRHGNPVRIAGYTGEKALYEAAAKTITDWQESGYETIAVICRTPKMAETVAGHLGRRITLSGTKDGVSSFTTGVMVLPVEDTKGLEFDAVLIFDPSKEDYPKEDAAVKLLYVAATRALHELAVLHLGSLTELIGEPLPKGKAANKSLERASDVTELSAPRRKKAPEPKPRTPEPVRNAEPKPHTPEPVRNAEPKPHTPESAHASTPQPRMPGKQVPLSGRTNLSPYAFGDMPENGRLRPVPHEPADLTIRRAKKRKTGLFLTTNYGTLRLVPLAPDIIRVTFAKEEPGELYSECVAARDVSTDWVCRSIPDAIELETPALLVSVGKKSGAIRFSTKDGRLLLSERQNECRLLESGRFWNFFEWERNERIRALGAGKATMLPLKNSARYISHGGRPLRLPCIFSDKGYAIAIAADDTVLGCNIPLYGGCISIEKMTQLDYYFMSADSEEELHEAYRYLAGKI